MNTLDLARLKEIRKQMMDLLEEAKTLVRRGADRPTFERSKEFWIGHIDSALGGGNYIDTYNYTMEKTIKELDYSDDNSICPECQEELTEDDQGAVCEYCGWQDEEDNEPR